MDQNMDKVPPIKYLHSSQHNKSSVPEKIARSELGHDIMLPVGDFVKFVCV